MRTDDYITNRINECLNTCKRISSDYPSMASIRKAIEGVNDRLCEPMQLAIVGRISSSKSTLVNAILGKDGVVRTGHEAETFNVSWLKYGSDQSPIVVHFVNGSHVQVPKEEWAQWASHSGEEKLKKNVEYIEVFASNKILKRINIIDTPGLDATSVVDSENTKRFLKKVRPDAVVLMFTKSLSEDSLKLIKDFQKADLNDSYSINPMNSLGVLSKPDLNWTVINKIDIIDATNDSIRKTLTSREDVKKVLFRILPVSALIGVASFSLVEEDCYIIKEIASVKEPKEFLRLFINADSFYASSTAIGISSEKRKALWNKLGLYGIYQSVQYFKEYPNATLDDIKSFLQLKSGFSTFLDVLYSHFGDRAMVIKAQNSIMKLLTACNKDRQVVDSVPAIKAIEGIRSAVSELEYDLHDLKEFALMMSIYDGTIKVDSDFIEEFKYVFGENGHGIINRLQLSPDSKVDQMICKSIERYNYWNRKYITLRKISENKAYPYSVIAKSYKLISERLELLSKEYEEAVNTVNIYNRYIYGK